MQIMIATLCSGGLVHHKYTSSILTETFLAPDRLQNQSHYNLGFQLVQGNSGLSKDRSILASSALATGMDKIVFIDADQSWQWPQLKALIDSPNPIVAAVTPMKMPMPRALNFTPMECDLECFSESNGVPNPKGLVKLMIKYPEQEIEVALAGTGMMCIDISVLKKMALTSAQFKYIHPFTGKPMPCYEFFPSGAADGIYWGEDHALCRNARHAGFKIHINPYCQIGHHGDGAYFIQDEL